MSRNLVHLFEVGGGDAALLDDESTVRTCVAEVIRRADLTPVAETAHRFEPQGMSLAVLLAESHVAVHTWPEAGTAYVTLTTCRPPASDTFADDVRALLCETFRAATVRARSLS